MAACAKAKQCNPEEWLASLSPPHAARPPPPGPPPSRLLLAPRTSGAGRCRDGGHRADALHRCVRALLRAPAGAQRGGWRGGVQGVQAADQLGGGVAITAAAAAAHPIPAPAHPVNCCWWPTQTLAPTRWTACIRGATTTRRATPPTWTACGSARGQQVGRARGRAGGSRPARGVNSCSRQLTPHAPPPSGCRRGQAHHHSWQPGRVARGAGPGTHARCAA